MYTLKEIGIKYANKQPKMVDDLTENTPVLERMKWEAASHNMWNTAEKLVDIQGAGWVNANASLPTMNVGSELVKVDLTVLGGEMEVRQDTADQFGGPAAYFAKKEPHILKRAGEDTERKLIYENWLAKAIADGNAIDAGAISGGVYSIVAMRLEEGVNNGLFDPTQFNKGLLLNKFPINGGNLYKTTESGGTVLGYGVAMKGRFGWQNLSTRNVAAICNIQEGKLPTAAMVDDILSDVRAKPADTILICHPKGKTLALAPFKESALQMGVQDKEYNRMIDFWNGVPVITTYNMYDGTETVVTGL
jgi:hypothetical protein